MFTTQNYDYPNAIQKITQLFEENAKLKEKGLPIAVLYKNEKYNAISAFMVYQSENGEFDIFDPDGDREHYGTFQETLEDTKGKIFIFEDQE